MSVNQSDLVKLSSSRHTLNRLVRLSKTANNSMKCLGVARLYQFELHIGEAQAWDKVKEEQEEGKASKGRNVHRLPWKRLTYWTSFPEGNYTHSGIGSSSTSWKCQKRKFYISKSTNNMDVLYRYRSTMRQELARLCTRKSERPRTALGHWFYLWSTLHRKESQPQSRIIPGFLPDSIKYN